MFRRPDARTPRNVKDYAPKFCRTKGCQQPFHHEYSHTDTEGVEWPPTPHDGPIHVDVCHTSKCREPEGHAGAHTSAHVRRAKLGEYGPHA